MTDKSKSHKKAKFMNLDRQTDRKIDKQTDSKTIHLTDRWKVRPTDSQTDNDKLRQTV